MISRLATEGRLSRFVYVSEKAAKYCHREETRVSEKGCVPASKF